VKGYLRVGAQVGDGAFIDHQFNTTDIFVVMPVGAITQRYLDRFCTAEAEAA
jgi:putative hemolysin